MNISKIIDTSYTILLCRRCYWCFKFCSQKMDYLYKQSNMYGLIVSLWIKFKIYLGYSIFGRIVGEGGIILYRIFMGSKAIQGVINLCAEWRVNIEKYFLESRIRSRLLILSAKLYDNSNVKSCGIFVLIMITVNILVSIILGKPITIPGWWARAIVFLIALVDVLHSPDWVIVKDKSIFLNFLRRMAK